MLEIVHSNALVSPCERYRYWLTRRWDLSRSILLFVMLNPSTADVAQNDPTVRKCMGFAHRMGHGGIEIVNLYAYRATKPQQLVERGYPVGPDNDKHIRRISSEHKIAICAWGVNAKGRPSRVADVVEILDSQNCRPMALRLTANGTPWHPLMLPYSAILELSDLPS